MLRKKALTTEQDAHCLLRDVGINSINRQHLRLASYAVEFNNILADLAQKLRPTNEDWRHIDSLFARVSRFVESHFREEEELMVEHGYPDYQAHKQLHVGFVNDLIDVQSKINNRDEDFKEQFGPMLWDWLIHHINHVDYGYREFFQSKGLK